MPNKKKSTANKPPIPVFFFAGEHSGDLLGGALLGELKNIYPHIQPIEVGGESLKEQGLESLESLENLNIIGFSEILSKYRYLKKLLASLVKTAVEQKVLYAVLIDYPGFNLRLAQEFKKVGIPVVFYVSPQIWAWKYKRIYMIRDTISLMLTLFRFEAELYKKVGARAEWVGHPLPERIERILESSPKISKEKNEIIIALMPGSRKNEIIPLTPVMLESAKILHSLYAKKNQKVRFLMPNVNVKLEPFLKDSISKMQKENPNISIEYHFDRSMPVVNASDVVVLASGTATLETAVLQKPMVILYKVSWFTYLIACILIKTRNIGLVNILSGKEICKELIQNECKPDLVVEEVQNILENPQYRSEMVTHLKDLRDELGTEDAAIKSAQILSDWMKENQLE